MHRPVSRNFKRKQSQEPLLQPPEQKKTHHIKTRMQAKCDVKDTRKPTRFANQTNLPLQPDLPTKQNLSRSEEDTRVTEQDDSEFDLRSVQGSAQMARGREVDAYREEIRQYVLAREEKYMIEHGYMRNHRVLNIRMRSYLVKHVFRIAERCQLLRTTIYLAVYYMDFYFSRVFAYRDQFEMVAVAQTCLFIAMKYEEIYPPQLSEWVDPRNIDEILRLEADVLRVLDFQLAHYTLEHFLHFYLWENVPADSNEAPPVPTPQTLLYMDLSLFDLPMRQFRPYDLAKLLHFMGSKQFEISTEQAEKQDRLMVQHVRWMVERNGDAMKYLINHKYHGLSHLLK